ncbi:MAG: ABC transporter substrate-binding protein [Sciscionella sp.]
MNRATIKKVAAVLAALAVTATACSTKGSGGGGSSESGGVKTGRGVTAKTINLGVLTDLHGEFAVGGTTGTLGNQLFWNDANAKGGICGRQVKLTVKDHGYDVQQAVTEYAQIKDNVLALQQLLGSPMTASLSPQLKAQQMLAIPESWASTLLSNPDIMIVGETYDVELINGVDYLMEKGKLHRGDTIGHIYQEGEYGEDGLLGTKYAAKKLGLKLIPQKIKGSDTDVSAQITNLKNAGAKAIFMTTGPKQFASAAGASVAAGYNVPIVGNSPVFVPGLLNTSAGAALQQNTYVLGPNLSLNAKNPVIQKLLKTLKQKHPDVPVYAGVVWGYGAASALSKVLQKACANKDLTPQGVQNAFRSLSNLDTQGVIVPLNYTKKGAPPSDQSYIFQPDKNAVGGLKRIENKPYTGKDVAGYKAPALGGS